MAQSAEPLAEVITVLSLNPFRVNFFLGGRGGGRG